MSGLGWAIAGYVVLQLAIGYVASRRVKSEEDYLLAGRRLGPALVTFSVFATWFGAETCVGSAGMIYAGGLGSSTADPFGYTLCLLLMGLVLAVPLWNKKLTTIADLLRMRFSPRVERIAVVLMIPTSILWAAAQIRAFGQVLSSTLGTSVATATIAAAGVAVIYTMLGGLLADAVNDFVQGIVLAVGLLVLGYVVLRDAGGLGSALASVDRARLSLLPADRPLLHTLEAWFVPVVGSLFAQELAVRVMAAKSPEVARRGTLAAAALYFSIGLIPVLIGLVGPALVPGLSDPEHVLPAVAKLKLGGVLYVIFVGALVSAILSTVDSTLLVASSLFSHNLVVPFRPETSERGKVTFARIGVAVFGTLACALALGAESVYSLVEQASAFGSAGITVSLLFGLFGGFGGPRSAAASILTGAGVYMLGAYFWKLETPFVLSLALALGIYVFVAFSERAGVHSPAK